MNLVDDAWICKVCGALNAAYRTTCGRCEENKIKNMKTRQYRSRQGRSDKQYVSSMKALGFALVMILGATLISAVIELVNLFILN
jgi:ribosomal protein L40E